MSLTIPSTAELSERIVSSMSAALGQSVGFLARSYTAVLSRVLAAHQVTLYKYVGFVQQQMFVATASAFETTVNGRSLIPLREWGRQIGIGEPSPARATLLQVAVSVLSPGGVLTAGTQLIRVDTGQLYATTAAVPLDSGTVLVEVSAIDDNGNPNALGAVHNQAPGKVLGFVSPLSGVAQSTTVTEILVTGTDEEEAEDYRARIIRRIQATPQGGAYADYRVWGEEAPGIINVYPYTGDPGTVLLFCEAAASLDTSGIPTLAQLEEVKQLVLFDPQGRANRAPVNVTVLVFPVARTTLTLEIENLQADDLPAIRGKVQEVVGARLQQVEPFIVGLSVPPRRDRINATELAGIVDEVVTEAGGTFSGVILRLGDDVLTQYTVGQGEKVGLLKVTTTTS